MAKARLEEARFGLQGPRDLLEKLQLDYMRLHPEEGAGKERVAYIVFDCAVTAWSLLDWVFHAIPIERRGEFGISATDVQKALRQFEDYLIKEKGMSWLRICHDLVTGAKHYYVNSTRSNGLTTGISGVRRSLRAGQPIGPRSEAFWPYIHLDDEYKFADDFFADAWLQWKLFLDDEKIDVR